MTASKILLLVAVALLLLASCKEKTKPGIVEVHRQVVTGVTLRQILPSEVDSFYETSGTVRAKAVATIAARTMGSVLSVRVREGDAVKAGQQLVLLDDRDIAEKEAAADSACREARKGLEEAGEERRLADVTYRRHRNLAEEKVVTQQEMDQVETQKRTADLRYERASDEVARAEAMLKEARINRGFTRVAAPFGGVVVEKRIEEGSMAIPGTPLLLLEDRSVFRIDASVNETLLGKVKIGTPVTVSFSEDKQAAGTVDEIVPAVDSSTRSFLIKINLREPGLRSGLYVRIMIPLGKKKALLVPANALVEQGQLSGVFVVDRQGVMTYRIIKTGQVHGDKAEAVSGLEPGEFIAAAGLENAVDGGVVKQ